jgi:hypothetical protein
VRLAQLVTDPEIRERLLQMAREWTAVAMDKATVPKSNRHLYVKAASAEPMSVMKRAAFHWPLPSHSTETIAHLRERMLRCGILMRPWSGSGQNPNGFQPPYVSFHRLRTSRWSAPPMVDSFRRRF